MLKFGAVGQLLKILPLFRVEQQDIPVGLISR